MKYLKFSTEGTARILTEVTPIAIIDEQARVTPLLQYTQRYYGEGEHYFRYTAEGGVGAPRGLLSIGHDSRGMCILNTIDYKKERKITAG